MSDMASALQLLLVKKQTTFGTPETSLAAGDLIETIGQPTMKWNPDGTEIELVGGGFDQDAFVPGAGFYDLGFQVYMATGGSEGDFGQVGTLLDLCGMTQALDDTDLDETDDQAAWTFTSVRSEITDGTVWAYSGDMSSSGSLLRKSGNIIFLPKWNFENGKPVTMELSGMGTFMGAATASTQPTVTKLRSHIPAFMNVTTLTINGETGYRVLSASIDASQEVALSKDASETYGRGRSNVTNRKLNATITVYKELPSVVDPETALLNRTEGALTMEYGTAPNKITFSGDYAQIKDIESSDDEGLETWTLTTQFNRNDFTITMDTAES